MKKFTDLQRAVEKHNQQALRDLQANPRTSLARNSKLEDGRADIQVQQSGESDMDIGDGDFVDLNCTCYGGVLSKLQCNCRDLMTKWLVLGERRGCVAVLSVLDKRTQPLLPELPVVLCIGINYGQEDAKNPQYLKRRTAVVTDTGMASVLERYLNQLKEADPMAIPFFNAKNFHLVAANYFPWITSKRWSKLKNSLEEVLLLRCFGYESPVATLGSLIAACEPDLLVFHGVHNAVQALGLETQRMAKCPDHVLLCDNLGYWVGSNVVRLT